MRWRYLTSCTCPFKYQYCIDKYADSISVTSSNSAEHKSKLPGASSCSWLVHQTIMTVRWENHHLSEQISILQSMLLDEMFVFSRNFSQLTEYGQNSIFVSLNVGIRCAWMRQASEECGFIQFRLITVTLHECKLLLGYYHNHYCWLAKVCLCQ